MESSINRNTLLCLIHCLNEAACEEAVTMTTPASLMVLLHFFLFSRTAARQTVGWSWRQRSLRGSKTNKEEASQGSKTADTYSPPMTVYIYSHCSALTLPRPNSKVFWGFIYRCFFPSTIWQYRNTTWIPGQKGLCAT